MVYNEQVSHRKPSKEDTHLLGSRVCLGSPKVAIWMNPSRTGDGIAPRSAELVVVGGMHVQRSEENEIVRVKPANSLASLEV